MQLLTTLVVTLVTDSDRCGPNFNNTTCPEGLFCSDYGYCGDTIAHRVKNFGRCGPSVEGKICDTSLQEGACCSQYGWCGDTEGHCQAGCQSDFGQCTKQNVIKNCVNNKHISFTFDDGPTDISIQALEEANALGIPLTFFHVVDFMYGNFDKSQRLATESTLASHSSRHIAYTTLTEAQQEADLLFYEDLMYSVTNLKPRLFRPPFGLFDETTKTVLNRNDYINVLWSLDSIDWSVASEGLDSSVGFDNIVNDYLKNPNVGHIILCHDLNTVCIEQMGNIYNYFTGLGYTFVDIETCIQQEAYKS